MFHLMGSELGMEGWSELACLIHTYLASNRSRLNSDWHPPPRAVEKAKAVPALLRTLTNA